MNSSERLDELLREVHRVRWDVILISETWRQGKEVWETRQGHIVVEWISSLDSYGPKLWHKWISVLTIQDSHASEYSSSSCPSFCSSSCRISSPSNSNFLCSTKYSMCSPPLSNKTLSCFPDLIGPGTNPNSVPFEPMFSNSRGPSSCSPSHAECPPFPCSSSSFHKSEEYTIWTTSLYLLCFLPSAVSLFL